MSETIKIINKWAKKNIGGLLDKEDICDLIMEIRIYEYKMKRIVREDLK